MVIDLAISDAPIWVERSVLFMIVIRWLDTVSFKNLHPAMLLAAQRVAAVYEDLGQTELWITSAADGVHKVGSLHPKGRALDFRTHGLALTQKAGLERTIQKALSARLFDAMLEDFGLPNEHLHIEYTEGA